MPWRGPLGLGAQPPRCGMTPPVRLMDSHALALPFELGSWTPTLYCDPSTWIRFPRFIVAPRVVVMDSHTLMRPFD